MSKLINKKELRYLFAYACWREGIKERYEGFLNRQRARGYDVEGFCITLNPPRPRIDYPILNEMWTHKKIELMNMYEKLEEKLSNFDVFILHNGANIHEEFLNYITTYNAYICFDDPESSEVLSKPVAKYFDLAFTGNISCVNLYKSWGIKNADFIPLGFIRDDYIPSMTEEEIIKNDREIDIIFLGERESPWRRSKLDHLINAFPNMLARGRGWPKGFLRENERISSYQNSKIGINIHNSVGPVNLRTYMLPANGVLQICDNKHMLGYLFKLGEEVIGYSTIDEAIELIKYYLSHNEERKKIALNGWKRAIKDYSEEAVWDLLTDKIVKGYRKDKECKKEKKIENILLSKNKKTRNSIMKYKNRAKLFLKNRVKNYLNQFGYEIRKKETDFMGFDRGNIPKNIKVPYIENPEGGPKNFELKHKRLIEKGGPFEWPDIIALNQAVVSLLGDEKKILEIGSGTGCFAWHAAMDKTRYITASEMDKQAREWAKKIDRQRTLNMFQNG